MKFNSIGAPISTVIILLFNLNATAQNSKDLWIKTSKEKVSTSRLVERKSLPAKALYFHLDINELKDILRNAPNRNEYNGVSNVEVSFPNPDGSYEMYRVLEASVMHPDLQSRHTDIRTYIGQSIDNPSTIMRFSITPHGLHTMTLTSGKGTHYIDPYSKDDHSYIIYSKKDLPNLKNEFICGVMDEISTKGNNKVDIRARNANDGMMRDFRLALASTIEYSEFHWMAAGLTALDTEADKKAAVLAAMVVTMNRVNGVYEKDLSITMTLIANNEDVIFIDSDSYTNDNGSTMLSENQTEIDNIIGTANYDIGHVFSTGGGGIATLGVPCVDGSKARGVTGLTSPVGDVYDIDFVAHEMGHQFGANHTFNGNTSNCSGGTRVGSNAYEPGSGSTIMAYAGICTPQNVQSNSDPYFHQASISEIWSYVTTGTGICAAQTVTGNSAPTAIAGNDYTIPIFTPYKLTGSSTDTDGIGSHTFTWEQYDLGAAGVPDEFTATGPLVRTFEGTTDPVRYIPRLDSVLVNGGTSTTWEKLVNVSRTINFQLTVRDNGVTGGQTDSDGMIVTTDDAAGPFLVTSQNTDQLIYASLENILVTWDVASTDVGAVDTDNVNILLSVDGGLTYPHILASGTPNDGSQNVDLPIVEMPNCRIMVEGAGNIFYAVNTNDFAVGNYTYQPMEVCNDYVFNTNISVPEDAGSYTGYVLNVPDSETITDMDINVNITHNDNLDLWYGYRAPFENPSAFHELASGICSGSANTDLTFDDEGIVVNCSSTDNGDNVIPQTPMSDMDGNDSAGDWNFFITDITVGDGDIATWNSTTLTICHSELVLTLDVDDFRFEDVFSVFPNPNNGKFNVKLNSNSGNNINISVYDIRGRRIFNTLYSNTTNFNEVINLINVQSGLYILKVDDGARSDTKKIIIN